jgi:hypothetical protein
VYKIDLHTLQKIYFGEKQTHMVYDWKNKKYIMAEPIENKRAKNL